MAFTYNKGQGLLNEDSELAQKLTNDTVNKILPLLNGISFGQIDFILDKVKREVTLYPVKIELPLP